MRARGAGAMVAAAALLAACGGAGPSRDGRTGGGPGEGTGVAAEGRVRVVPRGSPERGARVARVELAADPASRAEGLSGRGPLPPGEGMLFVYPDEAPREFWMRGCRHPLGAAYLDASGRVLRVVFMDPPPEEDLDFPSVRYPSNGPAKFVLEMAPEWFREAGLREGETLDLSAALRGVEPR